jgi:hypothetical protein
MSDGLGITVVGFEELKRKITLLASDKDKKREMLLILRQIAKPTLQAAKSGAPIGKGSKKRAGGSLKKSIGNITGKGPNPTIYVGPKVVKSKAKISKNGRNTFGNGWYGHMVEKGHNIYSNPNSIFLKSGKKKSVLSRITHKKKGKISGRTVGQPFMEQAYASTKTGATADAEKKMAAFIQRRINKLN